MRWRGGRRSGNVEDRRGLTPSLAMGGGGGILALALVVFLMGGDPTQIIMQSGILDSASSQSAMSPQEQQDEADFASVVLGSTEDVWSTVFMNKGQAYEPPRLVLFTGAVESACGFARSAVGPFYCPVDRKVYLDLDFFHELEARFHAPGDFARAYVIAHEVGHHIQTLTGVSQRIQRESQRLSQTAQNALSVRVELQADCYAGVWAHYAGSEYDLLEEGDVDEALNAATQIGDDRLEQESQGYIVPDSFTHGTSKQRYQWFETGYKGGKLESCDTFSPRTI